METLDREVLETRLAEAQQLLYEIAEVCAFQTEYVKLHPFDPETLLVRVEDIREILEKEIPTAHRRHCRKNLEGLMPNYGSDCTCDYESEGSNV